MLIPVSSITVPEDRIREEYPEEKFQELKDSIRAVGQLQPILVIGNGDGRYVLEFGEHRHKAIAELHVEHVAIRNVPIGQINAETRESMSDEMRLMIEFEEQERRVEFTWQEKAKYVRKFHTLFTSKESRWTAEMTAAALRLSPASISYYLNLDKIQDEHPEVAKAATMNAAIKRAKVAKLLDSKRAEAARDISPAAKRAGEILVNADAKEWIKTIRSDSIDLINFDPPWGDEVSRKSAENWDSFDDSTATSDELLGALLPELFRVLKPNSYMIYWYRQWAYADAIKLLEHFKFDLKFTRTPWIWYKPDKTSDQNRFPEKQPIDSYETFFLARKGDPVFNEREVQNVLTEPRTPRALLIHPTEKPLALMERLVRLASVPGATVLDPTAGSAAFLHAALKLSRKPLGCELHRGLYDRALGRLTEALK